MTDALDFLDAPASEAEPAAPAASAPAASAPADNASADKARDGKGRFAPSLPDQAAAEKQAAPNAAKLPEPTTAPEPEPGLTPSGHVPLSALLDTRDKAKQAEERARQAEERLAALEAAKAAPAGPPDRYADPDGYDDWFQATMAAQQRELQVQVLSLRAEATHGPELVQSALEWGRQKCKADPTFDKKLWASANPVEDAVTAYQQEQALSALSDPEQLRAFNEWRAGQSAAPAQSEPAATPQQRPRPSLANLPAAGAAKPGEQPVGPGVAFDAIFTE